MQGELVARSDALRHTVLELEKQRTEYETKLSNQEIDCQAALRQLEIKFKEESDKVKQLEGESNERGRLLTEANSQSSGGEHVMENSSSRMLNLAKDLQKITAYSNENYLPELEFSSVRTRKILTSEQNELPVDLPDRQPQFQLARSADTLESRGASLKLANQQLRAEVEAACRAVRRLPRELKQKLQPALDITKSRTGRSHEVSLHSMNDPTISHKLHQPNSIYSAELIPFSQLLYVCVFMWKPPVILG
ncbi:hypothetical protein EG68_06538 [Paragonimus skrjabini miyazakii]|uniref:Uncharacterized protein n=1 Tax=Paragonimus skrjabini miyazakii TaxID=59628 RepID=A0A8S9YUX7_9TREM|nr:hypothetical protein EG68_06538 [Paragonimus skrjabini miyazakii]